MKTRKPSTFPNISFVIPAYNTAGIIEGCIEAIAAAAKKAKIPKWEIIVADDGSKDGTVLIARNYAKNLPVSVVKLGGNKGRIAARKKGIDKAQYDMIGLVDTKTVLDENAFVFLGEQFKNHPNRQVWCPHVHSDTDNNVVAAFNEALVRLIWRRYLEKPRLVGFGIEDFDFFPKGGTCIISPKQYLLESYEQFDLTQNLKNSSDDIPLLRYIATKTKLWMSPEFSCFYRARTGMNQFIPWIYSRGQLFTDGHLHWGTRFSKYIVGLLLFPWVYLAGIILWWPIVLAPLVLWAVAIGLLGLYLPRKNWAAVIKLSWVYAFFFIAGLYKGTWVKIQRMRSSRTTT